MRASRGKRSPPGLIGREAMAALLPARCQDLASTRAFHPCAETVRLAAAAHARLKGTLRQSNLPPAASAARIKTNSLFGALRPVKASEALSRQTNPIALQEECFLRRYSSNAARKRSASFCSR